MEHTTTTRITVLKHLVAGRDLDFVATVARLTRDQVSEIATHHGYPKTESMQRAIEILESKASEGSDLTSRPMAAPAPRAETPRPPARPATTSPSSVTNPDARPIGRPDEIRVLLNTAKGHPSKRIQSAANKVIDDIDKLKHLIAEDQEKHAARREAEAERAAAKAEIERLEKQLRDAKAKLRPTKTDSATRTTPASDGPTAADIRAWARENNIDVPARGVLPQTVKDAYAAAQASDAA
jgi:hypothetical protein